MMNFYEHFRTLAVNRFCNEADNDFFENLPDDIQNYVSGREYDCYKRGFIDGIRLATE